MKKIELTPKLAAWIAFLIPMIVFFPVVFNHFVNWDDPIHLTANPYMQNLNLEKILFFWKAPYFGLYVPVTYNLWQFIKWFSDLFLRSSDAVHVFHFVSVLVHAINTLLVFYILKNLKVRDDYALLGCLFFALHPIQVESVSWVSEQKGLFASIFILSSFLMLQLYFKKEQLLFVLASLLLFLLGALAKPTAVSILPAVFIYLYRKQNIKKTIVLILPWILVSCFTIFMSMQIQKGPDYIHFIPAWWERPLIYLDNFYFYLQQILIPINFGIDYGRRPGLVLSEFNWLLSASVVIVLFLFLLKNWKKHVWILSSVILAILFQLPTSGLIPFAFQNFSSVADRYAYLSMVMFGFLFAELFSIFKYKHKFIFAILILVVLSGLSIRQEGAWKNSLNLAQATLKTNPESALAIKIRGGVAHELGNDSLALLDMKKFLRMKLSYEKEKVAFGIGLIYGNRNNIDSAIFYYRKSLNYKKNLLAQLHLGELYGKINKLDSAKFYLEEAIQNKPNQEIGRITLDLASVEFLQHHVEKARNRVKFFITNHKIPNRLQNQLANLLEKLNMNQFKKYIKIDDEEDSEWVGF